MRVPTEVARTVKAVALACMLVVAVPGVDAQDTGNFEFDATVRAAEGGDAEAQLWVGRAYQIGYSVEENHAEAAKWYRRAAEQGHAEAQNKLGYMYRIGSRNAPRNDAEAAKWYRLAAEQGHTVAQISLGAMYFLGKGVPQDKAEGTKWIHLAAERGDSQAQYMLGAVYSRDGGVPRDLIQAHMWLHLAATSDDLSLSDEYRDKAAKMRDAIGAKLSAEDFARTQALARDWKPSP